MFSAERARCCVGACETRALRVVVRDMGNGVDRIELAEYIDMDAARSERSLPGRTPVSLPYPDRLLDICKSAARTTGECIDCIGCIPTGHIRAIDERTMEIIIWRKP